MENTYTGSLEEKLTGEFSGTQTLSEYYSRKIDEASKRIPKYEAPKVPRSTITDEEWRKIRAMDYASDHSEDIAEYIAKVNKIIQE